ncbi:amidase family protein [Paraburkholderia silviterrae]|uniref:Amidase domain-containing protein n=1 Tax=Paraburkholderia silviterrae TaxID=2528715 RepID=A0A4V2ZY62_9BURK|nr:amidase family protein [Paraburkholderia silviterrae]TDG18991.1 hypothetical protein EYW47_32215 [Paraburkholderia silviterrae]
MSAEAASWSLCEAARALRAGRLSAVEYVTDLIAHERARGDLGAYITRAHEQALDAAREADRTSPAGPLHGMPLVVKDNIDVAGIRTTGGTPRLHAHMPASDSAVWRRLAAAGAMLLGKTSMHELAYGVTGICVGAPTARNPVNTDYLAGGSSSGTATAVAAGFAPAGLGTDTGGSARIPAAFCGIVGFRPTTGRYPHAGVLRISPSRDTVGLMARDPDDIVLLDSILAAADGDRRMARDAGRPIRLAVPDHAWHSLDPDVARVAANALALLERAGCVLVSVGDEILGGPSAALLDVATAVPLAETPAAVAAYLADSGSTDTFEDVIREVASPDVRGVLAPLLDAPFPREAYRHALAAQARLRAAATAAHRLHDVDAVVLPSTILPSPSIDVGEHVVLDGASMPTFLACIRNTAPAAVLGAPSVTLPAGKTRHGLPVGLQFDGQPHADTRLLDLARQCSRLLESVNRP